MFGADEVRVFGGHEVKFECRCSRERVANVLRSLGVEEVRSVIAEQGAVTVTCEFCQKPYKFDAIDTEQLFDGAAPQGVVPRSTDARSVLLSAVRALVHRRMRREEVQTASLAVVRRQPAEHGIEVRFGDLVLLEPLLREHIRLDLEFP